MSTSLPVRECGLKSHHGLAHCKSANVTPRAGVWIEINDKIGGVPLDDVTPRAGVWIEMIPCRNKMPVCYRHSPCGSVD